MGDLVWVILFFPNLWWKNFSLTYNVVRFFPALYTLKEKYIFFSVGIFSPTYFLASQFAEYFFLKLPISPLESQMVAPNVLIKLQT